MFSLNKCRRSWRRIIRESELLSERQRRRRSSETFLWLSKSLSSSSQIIFSPLNSSSRFFFSYKNTFLWDDEKNTKMLIKKEKFSILNETTLKNKTRKKNSRIFQSTKLNWIFTKKELQWPWLNRPSSPHKNKTHRDGNYNSNKFHSQNSTKMKKLSGKFFSKRNIKIK